MAVEAIPVVYDALSKTAAANGFTAVHAALWSTSGEQLTLRWDGNQLASASAIKTEGEFQANVLTLSVGDLFARYPRRAPAVAKLDVEGAEVAALEGAGAAGADALWIYEDGGWIAEHTTTRWFLVRGWTVLRVPVNGASAPVTTPEDVTAIKVQRSQGYNFVAYCPGGPWSGFSV